MKVEEAIQRVQSLYSKGVQSNDTRLTSRHTYSALTSARSLLLRQQFDKNQKISNWNYQILPCVELITAPIHECECIPNNNCSILRTKHKLPKPITGIESSIIKSVASLDGNIIFNESSFETNKYSSGNKYTANKPDYYPRNGYLYITTLKILKAITVNYLADDFIEAYNFPSLCDPCEGCECQDIMNLEFPIDKSLSRALFQIANEELIIMMKQIGEDKTNDSSDNTDTAGKMIHQPQQE